MNKNRGFNYYDAYLKQVDYALELACNLNDAISAGDFGSQELMGALHVIENDADEACHEVQRHLLADFVTPFERRGMMSLANALDDMSDALEDVAIQAYSFHCRDMHPAGAASMALVVEAITSLRDAVLLLKSLPARKDDLGRCLVDVQDKESECDRIFIRAVHALYGEEGIGAERRMVVHAILSAVEQCADAVEGAAEQLEFIMVENC
ncbi:MAG: DUF47 family protein [Coriobacteriaceae bacterium]|nr:DUF47 family protein [Coriobacteriaceae bacterium]